jgi:hypothetical protein
MKKIISLFVLMALVNACRTVHINTKPIDNKTNLGGNKQTLFYTLPKKEYSLTVKIAKTTLKKGVMYDNCAKNILEKIYGLTAIPSDAVSYEVSTINLASNTIPDTSKQYAVQLTNVNRMFIESKVKFDFTESGLVKNSELESENKSLEFGIKVGSIAFGAVGKLLNLPSNILKPFSSKGSDNYYTYANIDSSLKLSCPSIKLLNKLTELSESRENILLCKTCEKADAQKMISLIATEEKKILAMLVGTKQIDTLTYILPIDEYITKANSTGPAFTLFSLSNDGSITLGSSNRSPTQTILAKLSSYNYASGSRLSNATDTKTTSSLTGLRYNIPNICKLKIYDASTPNQPLVESIESIPQLGKVAALPSNMGGFKNSQGFTLDTKTGALIQFTSSKTAVKQEVFDPLLNQLEKIPDYVSDRNSTKREIDYLKLQIDYLKTLKEYEDLKKKQED